MKDKLTVRKIYFVWDFEKEEAWLNEMALSGWALERVGLFVYHFVKCEPGEYQIRVEMHSSDEGYMSFMRELGAEYIGRIVAWVYFRRKSSYGEFDIFSDIDSKIKHLEKIALLIRVIGFANILVGIINTMNPTNIGFINLLCACLLMYALGRIREKAERLKLERVIHE